MKGRNTSLDLMRFLGVLIIMIAHSNPPGWLFQLRNFGTPLLIVASALTHAHIYRNREMNAIPYLKKRISRLILPAWIFLTFFFLFFLFYSIILKKDMLFDPETVISSYLFYSGIGFVWIFNVYLILALITPGALKYSKTFSSNVKYFAVLGISYLIYEIFILLTKSSIPENLTEFFNTFLLAIIPYTLLFLYGLKLGEVNAKSIAVISFLSLLIFLSIALNLKISSGTFVPTQEYKYPPTLYYLSYAVFALNLTYLVCRKIAHRLNSELISWLSANSIWIYLWHIFAYYLWDTLITVSPLENRLLFSLLKSISLLSFGVTFAYAQRVLVTNYILTSKRIGLKTLGEYLV